MKLKNPMLVVTDIDRSVEFYKKVFGLHIIMDFGANKTLTGGLALQTAETYKEFIGASDISFGGNNFTQMLLAEKAAGYAKISLSVQKDNYAVKLYRKAGFTTVKETTAEGVYETQIAWLPWLPVAVGITILALVVSCMRYGASERR